MRKGTYLGFRYPRWENPRKIGGLPKTQRGGIEHLLIFFAVAEFGIGRIMAEHIPVLLGEVLDLFKPVRGDCYLDATFGGGGLARAILEASPESEVVALDCDPEARQRSKILWTEFGYRFRFHDTNFREVSKLSESGFAGAILDLGVSAHQLERPERGFSFQKSGPVDMRFDPRRGISGSEFLERSDRGELERAVREYGQERHWRRVVGAIVGARGTGILGDTLKLAALVSGAVGRPGRRGRTWLHPATQTFQGIRMAVNSELENLRTTLPEIFAKLAHNGVLAVISFHSLEDRIVKRYFRGLAGLAEHRGDPTPRQLKEKRAELLTKRPIRSSAEERHRNPRSRSARLRAVRKETE